MPTRRAFLGAAAGWAAVVPSAPAARFAAPLAGRRPAVSHGVQSGEVTPRSAVLWARCDRPAVMRAAWRAGGTGGPVSAAPVSVGPRTGLCGKVYVTGLPPGRTVRFSVRFESPDGKRLGEPAAGSFRTPAVADGPPASVRFAWSGDTAGQGFGIDRARGAAGGMLTYRRVSEADPDFLVHCGDTIYADDPFPAEIPLDDGTVWRNETAPGTGKVAEILAEFRANFRYNLRDDHVRACNARVPLLAAWDDHETVNN